ncbi:WecB/TagA/CpsF family glycosyltransferase [Planctomycetota bacterium]
MKRATVQAGLTLPDGTGIILAARLLGHSHSGRLDGPSLMLRVCDLGRSYGYRHFFYGGLENVADRLAGKLTKLYPGLKVAGTYCPPFRPVTDKEDRHAVQVINAANPDIVWIGLGAPKQERWMAAHMGRIQATVMIGVGAAFDFHSGNIKWSPAWIRRLGMEWAYRLAQNPSRMWRRNIIDSPLFLSKVLRQRFAISSNNGSKSCEKLSREALILKAILNSHPKQNWATLINIAHGKYPFVFHKHIMDSQYKDNSAVKNLFVQVRAIYRKTPNEIRWILWPVKLIYRLFNVLRLDLWAIVGDEISSGQKLAIIYAGHDLDKNFLVRLAFDGASEEHYIGKKWLWQIPQTVKKDDRDCSLAVVEVPNSFRALSEKMKCLYIPSWVNGETDISVDNPLLFKHKNTSLKSDLNKLRKNKLQFEVTNDLSELHNFYYNMYLPYISKVHGSTSKIMSYDYVKREFRKGGLFNDLLLIKEQEEYIAGVLLHYKKNRAKLSTLGVKDGRLDYVKGGAIGAICYFSVQYLSEKGFTRIDFGGSRSFLKDGVLRFKRKWNQKISNKKEIGFLIKMISKTEAVKGFFLNNPFIYEDKMGLNGAIFVPGDQFLSKDAFAKIYKDYYIPGLSKLVIYRFGKTANTTLGIVPHEYSEKIIMCSAETILGQC